MAQRFIICTNSGAGNVTATVAWERNAVTDHLRLKGWDVWHWFEDLWLVINPTPVKTSPEELRKELSALFAYPTQRYVLVFQVDKRTPYAGWGPEESWDWMRQKWGSPDQG